MKPKDMDEPKKGLEDLFFLGRIEKDLGNAVKIVKFAEEAGLTTSDLYMAAMVIIAGVHADFRLGGRQELAERGVDILQMLTELLLVMRGFSVHALKEG
jgi:hypothetical protein